MRQQEFLRVAVERKDLRAGADADDEHDLRTVNEKAAGELVDARLQEGRGLVVMLQRRKHREDRPDGGVGVGVGGAIEGVDGDQQRRLGIEQERPFHLLGGDGGNRGPPQRRDDAVVGEDVDLLLIVDLAAFAR